jgi:hypothetical protein
MTCNDPCGDDAVFPLNQQGGSGNAVQDDSVALSPAQIAAVVEAAVATLLEEFSDLDVDGRVLDELQARYIAGSIVARIQTKDE